MGRSGDGKRNILWGHKMTIKPFPVTFIIYLFQHNVFDILWFSFKTTRNVIFLNWITVCIRNKIRGKYNELPTMFIPSGAKSF